MEFIAILIIRFGIPCIAMYFIIDLILRLVGVL